MLYFWWKLFTFSPHCSNLCSVMAKCVWLLVLVWKVKVKTNRALILMSLMCQLVPGLHIDIPFSCSLYADVPCSDILMMIKIWYWREEIPRARSVQSLAGTWDSFWPTFHAECWFYLIFGILNVDDNVEKMVLKRRNPQGAICPVPTANSANFLLGNPDHVGWIFPNGEIKF